MQLTYIRLLVKDFAPCYRFYRDVIGFKPTFGEENDVYADFDTGSASLALFARSAMSEAVGTTSLPVDQPGQDHVAIVFQVEDVDEAFRQLEGKGVTFVTPPTNRPEWGERTIHFRDPDGNLIELYHFIPMGSLGATRFAIAICHTLSSKPE